MAKLKIDGSSRARFGNKPFGNEAVHRHSLETGATGILLNSRDATAALAVNDVITVGLLQAGLVADTVKIIVSTAFGAGVKCSLGFAYADGVDSAVLSQDPAYFGTAIDISAAGEIAVPLKKKLLPLPKDAFLVLTITGAAVAQAAYADVVVKGELLGAE